MKDTELIPQSNNLDLIKVDTTKLNEESLALINQIIEENNIEKAKDLTYLFNINQNKKTMVRVNKLNELLDVITDQAVDRFTKKPDEISNKELLDSLKTVQDLMGHSDITITQIYLHVISPCNTGSSGNSPRNRDP